MKSCLNMGPPSSEGTEAICRVPSGDFSQAPWYTLPDHLCRFRVRSIRWGYFLEPLRSPPNPIRVNNSRDPSHTPRPPWSFGARASHPLYRYSCLHSHFRYLQDPLPDPFTGVRNAPLPLTLS